MLLGSLLGAEQPLTVPEVSVTVGTGRSQRDQGPTLALSPFTHTHAHTNPEPEVIPGVWRN